MRFVLIAVSVLMGLSLASGAWADLIDELPLGAVYSVDRDKRVLTIINVETGKRHTYFLTERSRISSRGQQISLNDVQPGHAVLLDFRRTEIGREIEFLRVPELDTLQELPPINSTERFYISGVVTGVRAEQRFVIIRGPRIMLRRSLFVPENSELTLNGRNTKLAKVKVGDVLEAEYIEVDKGYQLLKAEFSRPKKE